jgi:DNA-directed RNA polymerase sigma subunit (sigma70/sigma32)
VLASLTPGEQIRLRQRVDADSLGNLTLDELQRQYETTRQRIEKIEQKALRKLGGFKR